ncbi:hypothetical protein F442_10500 [Phytophthora nicotianae P10297]|uniref:Uncharacterized protein n=4 Tax=Phytophthora nicotianae TaxID=4792 RepID=W2R9M6_PHYN3|nr:hypothetical protein PPTG_01998 [Phytophthora nicotianae INRA-310]ETI44730.1 hypothetical protein F443_10607 [Phytophthora nicotianae P1569]ETL91253.1 hypothetical protein L917_10197 [Phytophthora nicotianae]ETP42621.1 hypothetical protein F442_10500 [Phytophthora nicotianae P10297]KUF76275.1 hypothetical protein AM587_10010947 [Phytophthora nicotianae]ETN21926.1 hypothetical protein PPTG_01998 [Phytophthora nicotianae INRA-310]
MTDKFPVNLTKDSMEQINNRSAPTADVPEELRCQYSSKRCENQRTHKKSGGLHKFCAMHREKANRNQMRLDHRRRVMKQQQKELQRQQQAQQMQALQAQQQMQRTHSFTPVAMAAGQNYRYSNRMQRSPVGAMRSPVDGKPMSPPNMMISMSMPMQTFTTMEMPTQQPQQPSTPNLPLFDQSDLEILEALLFSSDEEQNDAIPVSHCSTPQLFRAPSFVNV